MRGVNRVTILGHLGNDPDVRYTQTGKQVVTLSLATNEKWTDQGGTDHEHTEWHRIVMFRRLAEIAAEYLRKGQPVYIDGKLRTRKWQDNNGQDRYTTEIIAEQMQMLGASDHTASATPGAKRRTKASEEFQSPPPDGALEDDIPFAPVRDL